MNRYTVIIEPSEHGAYYFARVPELEGCTAWGDTRAEALHQIQVVMEGHLEVAREFGDPIQPGK